MTTKTIKPCPFCAQKPQLKGKRLIHNSKLCFFKLDLEAASPEQIVDEWNQRPGENEHALSIIEQAVEEELRINLWGPSRQAVKDVLTRIESKLTEES